jgi:Putative threonine efflux protein
MLYFQTITQGVLLGFALAFMVGPAFFALIQTSINKGFHAGWQMAFGVSISDIIIAFIAWYGLTSLFETPKAQKFLSIVGGIVLLAFGIYTVTRRHITEPKTKEINIKIGFQFKFFAKGFLFNIANPTIWIYWLMPVTAAGKFPKVRQQIIFLASILLTTFLMDVTKCAIANELKRFMTDKVITYINRIIGAILIFFGIYLVISYFLPPEIMQSLPQTPIND